MLTLWTRPTIIRAPPWEPDPLQPPTSLACGAAPCGCGVSPEPGALLWSPSRAPPASSAPLPLGVRGLGESPLPGQPLPAASPPCLPLGSRLGSGASSCRCQGQLRVQAGQVDPTSKGLLCLLVAPSAWLYIPCFTPGCFLVPPDLAGPQRSDPALPSPEIAAPQLTVPTRRAALLTARFWSLQLAAPAEKEIMCCSWLLDAQFPWDYLCLPVLASALGCPKTSADGACRVGTGDGGDTGKPSPSGCWAACTSWWPLLAEMGLLGGWAGAGFKVPMVKRSGRCQDGQRGLAGRRLRGFGP